MTLSTAYIYMDRRTEEWSSFNRRSTELCMCLKVDCDIIISVYGTLTATTLEPILIKFYIGELYKKLLAISIFI
jgi:hypothetical protein